MILNKDGYKHYIERFNSQDEELVIQHIDNDHAWEWLSNKMPFFDCPDKIIEETYYFRWWLYRKHIKLTEDGYIITEFLPDVYWAGKHNSINCAVGHHLNEGRWLRDSDEFLNDYITFWFRKGGQVSSYSSWIIDSIWNYVKVTGDIKLAIELLPDFIEFYKARESKHMNESGLYWSHDDRDAMEISISGSGLRPTLNSYVYADAIAISKLAELTGQSDLAQQFMDKAIRLKQLVQEKLWDENDQFFKVIPLEGPASTVETWDFASMSLDHNVREQIGFIPWYFNLPEEGFEVAWEQLFQKEGFAAPYGPTTAEQRHPRFNFEYNHECLWNGPSWPFATSQTLTAMANILNGYKQNEINSEQYLQQLQIYAASHYRVREDGVKVSWLDENLDPYTGDWTSRTILEAWGWRVDKGGRERGKDYNHSTFNDLIITGLIGIRPREDNLLEINPLVPSDTWSYFCLDGVSYRGHSITVLYDRDGSRYGKGAGLRVYVDGIERAVGDLGEERMQVQL